MTEKTSNAAPAGEPLLINPGFTSGTPIDIEAVRRLADDAGTELVTIYSPHNSLPAEIPILINRKNGSAASIRSLIEEYRLYPERKKGTATVNTLDSFVDLTNRHKTDDSAIFADTDWRNPSLTAVVDYHKNESGGLADNGKHRVHYPFPLSEEWQAWIRQDGKPMDQADFAEWIEDHLPELAAPEPREADHYLNLFGLKVAAPNEMVKLSRGLQIHVESRVKNNVTLQSGEGEITWDEEHKDSAGNRITVPGLFILSIPPFFMGTATRIPVRLRYRASGGTIKWFFKLHRPDVVITGQIEEDLARAAEATGLLCYRGKPEMAAASGAI
jgi:uncharacterized protein YfdQ (DUF2303 family)